MFLFSNMVLDIQGGYVIWRGLQCHVHVAGKNGWVCLDNNV